MSLRRTMAPIAAMILAVACSGDDDDSGADANAEVIDPYDGYSSEVYDGTKNWICHPELADDECRDLSAIEVTEDGSQRPADLELAADPEIDCFYVYPTVSNDEGDNSDLQPDDAERLTVGAQAAPFASTCRMFAPTYRQLTLSSIGSGAFGDEEKRNLAYGDVLDAWQTYISQYNDGRGVVLIGHSQGTGHLSELLATEIDPEPELRNRLVSAILLGGTVEVPEGEDVGGAFDEIPACRSADQVGCAISFSSYPSDEPPVADAFFGRAEAEGERALCVDPVELAGGNGLADAIIPTETPLIGAVDTGEVELDVAERYIVLPDALEASCQHTDTHDFFGVRPVPDDRRPTGGFVQQTLGPTWGLHLYDANLAMGDLLEVVTTQASAFNAG